MFYLIGFATLLIALHTDYTHAVCESRPSVVWRNYNRTCPSRAICADVFDMVRDWYNGTQCSETRVLNNCLCSGGTACPIWDQTHQIFATRTHRQFLCEATCDLPWCGDDSNNNNNNNNNANNGVSRGVPASRRQFSYRLPSRRVNAVIQNRQVALSTTRNALEFLGFTYNRLRCRCLLHHRPVMSGRRRNAVTWFRNRSDFALRRFSTDYVCARTRQGAGPDPCLS